MKKNRRDEDSVTLPNKQHRYLRCRESPRNPWYGSIGSSCILQFDSNEKQADYQKKLRKPTKRIPLSSPYLLLSEDNTCYKVDTRPNSPTFTRVQLDPPLPPSSIINLPLLGDQITPQLQ